MELKFEVLASTSVKRKKPWPKFAWLSEVEPPHGLYLLDSCRISQVSPTTGKTRKKLPSLAQVRSKIALTSHSPNGVYLGGLTRHGDMFLWNKEADILESFVSPLSRMDSESLKRNPVEFQGYKLFLSNSGDKALLMANKSAIFLWENSKEGGAVWWKIFPPDGVLLPDLESSREAVIDAKFYMHPVFGECCSCLFIFTSRDNHNTTITHLLVSWSSPTSQFYSAHIPSSINHQSFPFQVTDSETSTTESKVDDARVQKSCEVANGDQNQTIPINSRQAGALNDSHVMNQERKGYRKRLNSTQFDAFVTPEGQPFQTSWNTVFYAPTDPIKDDRTTPLSHSAPPTRRGSYVCRLSPTGAIAALAINRKEACDTSVVFFSPLADTGLPSPVYLSKTKEKSGRSYWICDMSWLADGLLLACITKRGSLLILPRFGRPLKLVTHGYSLNLGPSTFLPLHPLITVSNTSGNRKVKGQPPDTSQSSMVDVYHQRFSLAALPHHPVLLCSDGYSFSILQLLTNAPLSQLVAGFVLDARKKLSLSASHIRSTSDGESFAQRASLLRQGDVHDFAATLSNIDTSADLDSTLGSTLGSVFGGGPAAAGLFAGLDAGAVHFAGVDSDLEQTQTSLGTSMGNITQKKLSMEMATFQLRGALALLLSCGKLEPGNGLYPQVNPLKHSDVKKIQREIQQACTILLSTFLTLMESSVLASRICADSAESTTEHLKGLFHELYGDILNVVPLDSYSQSQLELVTSLINGVLLTVLKSSLEEHRAFVSLSKNEHTIHFLKNFADGVCEDVTVVSEILESAVSLLDVTYGMRPLSDADSAFHTPLYLSKKRRLKYKGDVASHLSVSLTAMLEVLRVYWHDIQTCSDLANKAIAGINSSSPQHNRQRLRELGVLCKGLAVSLQNAMVTLKTSHAQIRLLIHGHKAKITQVRKETSPQTQRGPAQGQSSEVKGQDVQTKVQMLPVHCRQGNDGNPITYSPNLSLLLSKLEEYDLRGALEVVHSDSILSQSFSASEKRLFNLSSTMTSLSTLTHPHLMDSLNSPSHTQLSLASPLAQPVVASLARIMMAFFSNQKLLIPPSSLATTRAQSDSKIFPVPAPLDLLSSRVRLTELKRSEVVQAVRDQELSRAWTADSALALSLLGGLWEESCKFVSDLGEWKKAVLLSLAHINHSRLLAREETVDKTAVNVHTERLTHFTHNLVLKNLVSLLGLEISNDTLTSPKTGKGQLATLSPQHCTEERFTLITGTLQVCALGGLDSVLTRLVTSLTHTVYTCCQRLPQMVHSSVYLPAPPLYCPQPSIPEEEYIQCPKEYAARYSLSHLVHSLVLVLRASNCLHSCAQWYCSQLHKLVKAPGKVRETFSLPEGKKLKRLPQAMSGLANGGGGQQLLAGKDDLSSPVVRILLSSFRQLCSLLWLLHVRDQASAHLRKLQPSLSKPDRDPDTAQKASLWSCRLLPFTDVLTSSTRTPMDVQLRLTALSALSEWPNDTFLASLLALYFPNSSSGDRGIDSKFNRLMARLSSAHHPATRQPLSDIYQNKSQHVLSQQSEVFGEGCGQFRPLFTLHDQKLFEHDFQDIEISTQAFDVGCFLFEYDVGYLDFLDTLFAVTLQSESYKPSTSRLMQSTAASLSKLTPNYSDGTEVPFISKCVQLIRNGHDSRIASSYWESVIPLLHVLKEWSEIPQVQEVHQVHRNKGKSKKRERDGGSGVSAMRVNVPLELVANCLKQREEGLLMAEKRGTDTRVEDRGDWVIPSPAQPPSTSSVNSDASSQACVDETMHVEELEGERQTDRVKDTSIKHLHSKGERAVNGQTSQSKHLSAGPGSRRAFVGGFPLLQVPEGVLQGHLSSEEVQNVLMVSPPHRSKAERVREKGEKREEEAVERHSENGGLSVVDGEPTESSLSIGEFPSDVTFSFGEVVLRSNKPVDDTATETLLSTGGTHPQVLTQVGGIAGRDGERFESEKHTHGHQGGDLEIDINQTTSEQDTLINEDISLTLTQTLSSSTTVTLTEISQIEPIKSASLVPVDEIQSEQHTCITEALVTVDHSDGRDGVGSGAGDGGDGGDGGAKKEGLLSSLRSSQMLPTDVDSADCQVPPSNPNDIIGDIVRTEMRKILELQHQQLLSLLGNATFSPLTNQEGGVSSTANCPVDQPTPQLHVQAPPTVQASPLIQPPHVPIAQAPPTVQARPTDQAPPTVQAPSPVEAPDQQHLTSDESTAPTLNMDDLRSLTPSDLSTNQASHVTILIPPVQSAGVEQSGQPRKQVEHVDRHQQPSLSHKPQPPAVENASRKGSDLKLKARRIQGLGKSRKKGDRDDERREVGDSRQGSLCLSDLNTDSSSFSPGRVGPLTTSETTDTQTDFADRKRSNKWSNFEKKTRSSGFLTHTQQLNRCGSIQLLHLEPTGAWNSDRGGGYGGGNVARREKGGSGCLEHEFPGLPTVLKQFNDSIAPRFGHFATSVRERDHPSAMNIKGMPLLQLSHIHDQAPPLTPPPLTSTVAQHHQPRQPMSHQFTGTSEIAPRPLLIIPNQTFAPSASTVAAVHNQGIPRVQSSPHPVSTSVQHSNFRLPQIPIRPFVPLLLPPHVVGLGANNSSTHNSTSFRGPPLLQLNDPLSQMKREGFKLLKMDSHGGSTDEQKLDRVEQSVQPVQVFREQQRYNDKSNLPSLMKGQTRKEQPAECGDERKSDLHISESACSLTTVTTTTEDSSEVLPRGDKVGKPMPAGRRQRRSQRVAWKLDHGKRDKLADKDDEDVDSAVRVDKPTDEASHTKDKETLVKDKVEHTETPPLLPPPSSSATTVETKPLRQPQIFPTGGEKRTKVAYPDEIPLERLELRRLEMKSSFLPLSPQHEGSSVSPQHEGNLQKANLTKRECGTQSLSHSQLLSPAKVSAVQTIDVGVQAEPPFEVATVPERGDRDKPVGTLSTSSTHTGTQVSTTATVSTAVQVSPENFSGLSEKVDKVTEGKEDGADSVMDSFDVTSVSSLESEEIQLSESDDDVGEAPPTGTKDNEFTPPPLWYNSHSPIPIPIKKTKTNKKADSSISNHDEAPPPSSHFTGFNATPPPPLPLAPIGLKSVANEQQISPKSSSPSQIPESPRQHPSSVQTVLGSQSHGEPKPRPLRSDVIERLQQLEEQLNAIESTAKSVEGEFKTTNKILSTIDHLQAVSDTITAATDKELPGHDHSPVTASPGAATPLSSPTGDEMVEGVPMFYEEIDGASHGCGVGREREAKDIDNALINMLNPRQTVTATSNNIQHRLPSTDEMLPTGSVSAGKLARQGRQTESKRLTEREQHQQQRQQRVTKSREERDSTDDNRAVVESYNHRSDETGRKKEELRSWMIAKRRDRLAQFVSERDRLRQREKRPFRPRSNQQSVTGGRHRKGASQKSEQEKEFVAKRIEDAYSLMEDILTSKPSPSISTSPFHSNALTSSSTTFGLPPRGRGKGSGNRGQQQKRRSDSGGSKRVNFSGSGLMKRSLSDSKLYQEDDLPSSKRDVFGGSTNSLHGTHTITPATVRNGHKDLEMGCGYRSMNVGVADMKHTQGTFSSDDVSGNVSSILNYKRPRRDSTIRKISSVEGLTEDEQDKIALILASTDCDHHSVSSGSVLSNIDWEEVDRLLDS